MQGKTMLITVLASAALGGIAAEELPAGVPRAIWPDGTVTVPLSFTTEAYQREALRLVLTEANCVAEDLKLPEKLPITRADLKEIFIGPFGHAYLRKAVGNVTTSRYCYCVSVGNKFSFLDITDYDRTCQHLRADCRLPLREVNTNAAHQLATQWLAAVSMDVRGLTRDCQLAVSVSEFWNGIRRGEKLRGPKFVPIYDVCWISPAKRRLDNPGVAAYVELFAPTKKLLSLRVEDPRYILRKPLVFTNLASLFPGKATVTRYPPKAPIIIRTPLPPD